jgi:hypothetical protein
MTSAATRIRLSKSCLGRFGLAGLPKPMKYDLMLVLNKLSVKPGASQPVPFFFPHPPTAQAFTEQNSFRSFESSRNVLSGAKQFERLERLELAAACVSDWNDQLLPVSRVSYLRGFPKSWNCLTGLVIER